MSPPLVSVIVLSWNSRRFLEGCLASVEAQTHPRVELVVVDNASTDGSAGFVAARFPRALLMPQERNVGFCAGNNAGLKAAHGDHILFLNADARLEPRFLEEAIRPLASDPRVGMVSGKLVRFDGRTLDTTGQIFTRSRRVLERGYDEPDRGQYDQPGEIFSTCGAAALYRRALIDSISIDGEFFDEGFFAFGEDFDVGWRARNMGWRCWYQPTAIAAHFRGGTQPGQEDTARRRGAMARRPAAIQAHIVKNRYLAMLKNDTPLSFLLNLPFILAWDVMLWGHLVLRSPEAIPILWSHRRLLGRALRDRRLLRQRAAAGPVAGCAHG